MTPVKYECDWNTFTNFHQSNCSILDAAGHLAIATVASRDVAILSGKHCWYHYNHYNLEARWRSDTDCRRANMESVYLWYTFITCSWHLRMKSLEFNKSHAVKYHESIAFNIHLWHYSTDIIDFVGLKWIRHLIVTNVWHYRNTKQIFWHLQLVVQYRA